MAGAVTVSSRVCVYFQVFISLPVASILLDSEAIWDNGPANQLVDLRIQLVETVLGEANLFLFLMFIFLSLDCRLVRGEFSLSSF